MDGGPAAASVLSLWELQAGMPWCGRQNHNNAHSHPRHLSQHPWSELTLPSIADYVYDENKFGGNAQAITKQRWLHHTSFLWDFQEARMALLQHPARVPAYRKVRLDHSISTLGVPASSSQNRSCCYSSPLLLHVVWCCGP